MRGKMVLALATAGLLWHGAALAADQADKTFLTEAIQGNLAEIQVGKLAQQKGETQNVRQFGQMLVTDHTNANTKAESLAKNLDMTPPTEPNAKQKETYNKLSKASGTAFDREFARAMVNDHKETIAKFRKEARGKGDVADFAKNTLPTLEKHLHTAESLTATGTTGSSH